MKPVTSFRQYPRIVSFAKFCKYYLPMKPMAIDFQVAFFAKLTKNNYFNRLDILNLVYRNSSRQTANCMGDFNVKRCNKSDTLANGLP